MFSGYSCKISNLVRLLRQLKINNSKSHLFQFGKNPRGFLYTLNNNPILGSDFVVDLGVTIDSDLQFCSHIKKISASAMKRHGRSLSWFYSSVET